MTDQDLAIALNDLSKSVTDHKVEISGRLASLTSDVSTLQKAHDSNTKTLDEVLRLELSCPARAGYDGTNARIKQLEIDEKDRVESELKQARDEITEVGIRRPKHIDFSETPSGVFIKTVAPYLWKGALIFGLAAGASLVARCGEGDGQAVNANAIMALADAVTKTAVTVDEVKEQLDAADAGLAGR